MPKRRRENDEVSLEPEDWTWGGEHELGNWDVRGYDKKGVYRHRELEIANVNGVAADPDLITTPYGGEVNTVPTDTLEEQVEALERFLGEHPTAAQSHRSTMHVHIHIPGLKESAKYLKKIQAHSVKYGEVFSKVHHVFDPKEEDFETDLCWQLAQLRVKQIVRDDLEIPRHLEAQLKSRTATEFFEAGLPSYTTGRTKWKGFIRPACNIDRLWLKRVHTIEFRCFSGTTDPEVARTCFEWARDFTYNALHDKDELKHFEEHYSDKKFPQYEDVGWCPWKDRIYWHTMLETENKNEAGNLGLLDGGRNYNTREDAAKYIEDMNKK